MFLSLGEALIDLIPPFGAGLQRTSKLAVQPGGAPFNVAIALSRLGVPVTFLGAFSDDRFGVRLSNLLTSENIPYMPAKLVEGPTRLAVVDHATRDGASFRFYGDNTADTLLTMEDIYAAFASRPTGLYITSLLLGNPASAAVQRYAVELAIARGVPIFTDPNPRPPAWEDLSGMESAVRWLLANSQYAKLSLEDARAVGWADQPETLITRLNREFATQVVVTDGERGCWAVMDGQIRHVAPPAVAPVDPTGAGDAFCGAMIASIIDEDELTVGGLWRASVAGALATTAQGASASIPTKQRIEQFHTNCGT